MLKFDQFKELARNESLSSREKVGYNDIHREDKEENIFPDVCTKLNLDSSSGPILDIGCGCSRPVLDLIKYTESVNRELFLIDSKEMLDNLPEGNYKKISGEFPKGCEDFLEKHTGKIDHIVTYGVAQVVFVHSNLIEFLDTALSLLKAQGKLLIADIPNISKKKRFFDSPFGIKFHQEWSKSNDVPIVKWNHLEPGEMDDSIVFMILQRYRSMGYETYLLPQHDGLGMNKTREDILIVKN